MVPIVGMYIKFSRCCGGPNQASSTAGAAKMMMPVAGLFYGSSWSCQMLMSPRGDDGMMPVAAGMG